MVKITQDFNIIVEKHPLFESINKRINPVEGRLAITPAWFGFPHSAVMPISNTKYMIKTYLHYPGD